MRRVWLRVILAVFLTLALVPGVVLADNSTPETAVQFSQSDSSASGTLTGSGSGAFRYYLFDYPGGGAPITVHLTWDPGWGLTDAAFGFNVYGPSGQVGQGKRGEDVGAASTAQLDLATEEPGQYLVQVYSYTNGSTSAFTLEVKGLAPQAVAVGVADNASPGQAVAVHDPAYLATGSLPGDGGGSYSYFTVEYPGGETELGISLAVSPANWLFTDGCGFNVYEGGTLVVGGSETDRTATLATKTATVKRAAPGTFEVQIFNYVSGVTADYTLGISGGVSQVMAAAGNDSPEKAVLLTPTANAARGAIAGNSGGAFAFFGFNYQGGYEPVTIVLSSRPGVDLTGQGVGVMLYQDGQPVGDAPVGTGITVDTGLALHTLQSDVGGYYLIQVYNYISYVTAEYNVYVVGLR